MLENLDKSLRKFFLIQWKDDESGADEEKFVEVVQVHLKVKEAKASKQLTESDLQIEMRDYTYLEETKKAEDVLKEWQTEVYSRRA